MSVNSTQLTRSQLRKVERKISTDTLRQLLAGDHSPVIYTILRHVSASGLSREISLIYVKNNDIYNITYSAGIALDYPLSDKHGHRAIKVQGGGMDLGFHLVYSLSSVLYAERERAGYVISHRWL